jgi:hypothetical protein
MMFCNNSGEDKNSDVAKKSALDYRNVETQVLLVMYLSWSGVSISSDVTNCTVENSCDEVNFVCTAK